MAHRTPLGRALRLQVGAEVRVEVTADEIRVSRGNGTQVNEALEAAVFSSLRFNPDAGRFQLDPDSPLHKTGAQFRISQ